MDVWEKSLRTFVRIPKNSVIVQALRRQIRLQINIDPFVSFRINLLGQH